MKERGIIFTGESVRAIIDGRKTQTRRVVKPQPDWGKLIQWTEAEPGLWTAHDGRYMCDEGAICEVRCPYGVPGDRLYVKETWQVVGYEEDSTLAWQTGPKDCYYKADVTNELDGPLVWRSPMFMPRWASRITLEVVAVRVERLQDITEADAIAEGCEGHPVDGHAGYPIGGSPVDEFRQGWDSINGKRAPWAANPWVFVVSFRRLQ